MTKGELYEIIREIDRAEQEIVYAEIALRHGGSPRTIEGKKETLNDANRNLERLLEEEIQV